jgi:hypothetical protein
MVARFARHRFAPLAIAVSLTAAAGFAVANGALASTHRQAARRHVVRGQLGRWPFSIFSRPAPVHARLAGTGKVSAPEGGVFARASDVAGVTDELYAWHRTPQEDCLVDVEGGNESTIACSPSSVAEAEGLSWVGVVSPRTGESGSVVVAMVPDGVSKLEVRSASGATSTVAVVNNVADYVTQTSNLQEYRYTLPDGRVLTRMGSLRPKEG